MPENIPEYKLASIGLEEYSMHQPQETDREELSFAFNIGLEHRLSTEVGQLSVLCSAQITDPDSEDLLAEATTRCSFEVANLNSIIDQEADGANLPEALLNEINALSVSTTRGVIFALLRGTYLHNAVMPVIDTKAF